MATPSFNTKINRRLPGMEQLIAGEPHTVSLSYPYVIRLIEVPNLLLPTETVTIPGYNLTPAAPGPGQFLVDWVTGRITFHSTAAGANVIVTYYGLGSEVDADDINEVQSVIVSMPAWLYLGRLDQTQEDTTCAALGINDSGTFWFNTSSSQFMGFNGTTKVTLG